MSTLFERIAQRIDSYRDKAIEWEKQLTALPALDPSNGGDGELKKAELIQNILEKMGFAKEQITMYRAEDSRVSCGYRPNLVARLPGKNKARTLWLMSHMDVVPEGDRKNWHSDPWQARVEGNKIYGRGVEDNQQGIVSSLLLAQALLEENVELDTGLALLFVADEETANKFGIQYLLEKHQLFAKDDLIIVPDGGEPDGSMIEVAEKGLLWMKFTVLGKETHGSTPNRGVNAHYAAAHLIVRLHELYQRFGHRDEVFDPPTSTFEATKLETGVANVNTIPGQHTFYLDCRVMPQYPLDEVLGVMKEMCGRIDAEFGTKTELQAIQRADAAPPTSTDAPVVHALKKAIKSVYGVNAVAKGIGGGTVAAIIRRKGFSAAVWARMDETMHGANEYVIVDNLLGDAKVFAHILVG